MSILYGGIDLHASNCYCGIIDEQDRWVKQKRLKNSIEEVKEFFEDHKNELKGIVMESTYNGYWLMDGLSEAGYNVRLANPSKMGDYDGIKNSNDETDTRWLAKMLRLGILPEGYIYPKKDRPMRDLIRKLSPPASMVLAGQLAGRVDQCRVIINRPRVKEEDSVRKHKNQDTQQHGASIPNMVVRENRKTPFGGTDYGRVIPAFR